MTDEYLRETLAKMTGAIEAGATLAVRASSVAGMLIAELESATGARYCIAEAADLKSVLDKVLGQWNAGTITRRKKPR